MPGFFKAAAVVISGGAIVGTGAVEMIPEHTVAPLFVAAPIPDFAHVPCKQQLWLNADRACQAWTTPRRDVNRGRLAEPAAGESRVATARAPRTSDTMNGKTKNTHSARGASEAQARAAPPRPSDGRRVTTSRSAMESSL